MLRWFDVLGMISVAAIGLLVIVTCICIFFIPFPENGTAGSPYEHSHNPSGGQKQWRR